MNVSGLRWHRDTHINICLGSVGSDDLLTPGVGGARMGWEVHNEKGCGYEGGRGSEGIGRYRMSRGVVIRP